MDAIPSPSHMTWKDVNKILKGPIPEGEDINAIEETPTVSVVKEVRDKIESLIRYSTESEATVRVLFAS
jgi:hypothetical protein